VPELPEVETVMRGLSAPLTGHRLVSVEVRTPALRWPIPADLAARSEGRRVVRLRRRGKYILIDLEGASSLLLHLGMSGRMLLMPPGHNAPPEKHDHVVLRNDEGLEIRFNDPRRFGMLDLLETAEAERHRLLRDLGPEPLGAGFDADYLTQALAGRFTPLKAALLDQKTVAGLGNIYVSEALYAARLSPKRLAHSVGPVRAARLVAAIRAVLERAVAAGGSSLRDYVQTSGELGYFQHQWAVYDRAGQPCPGCDCGGSVKRLVQSGRSTFYCPRRQR